MSDRTRAALWSALAYVVVTAVLGRDVLAHLSTSVVHDAGDPLLTAAILHWNAWTLPLSHAWWQFPVFYPTPDTLAFSEHLLGLSVIATPIAWLTRDPLVTANLVTLLTYPLCAMATYLLARRLQVHAGAAFVAGLAFAFSPYRVAHLSHVQMLATFWAPVALLGLHAYLDTGRARWLWLYAAAWMLQVAANGYGLLFLSFTVGLWVVWFVIIPGRWRALLTITGATAAAVAVLAPVLLTYRSVHEAHGFTRALNDISGFGADVSALLCAPAELSLWGWLRVTCRAEGELFPGAVVLALAVIAAAWLLAPHGRWRADAAVATPRWRAVIHAVGIVSGALALAALAGLLVFGPWRLGLGPLRLTASSTSKPLLALVVATVVALATSRGVFEAARRSSVPGFYLVAAAASWVMALGPTFVVEGDARGLPGPFRLLMMLPGVDSLRVPARFWLMSTLCLALVAALVVSELLRRRRGTAVLAIVSLAAIGVLADGWNGHIPTVPAPVGIPDASLVRGRVVLTLPAGNNQDFAPEYLAVVGGWTSVNGYSGYEPKFYEGVRQGVRFERDSLFTPFRRRGEVAVVLGAHEGRLVQLVERQPGAVRTASREGVLQFWLPRLDDQAAAPLGEKQRIVGADATCFASGAPAAVDGRADTRWVCNPQSGNEAFTADLGSAFRVGAIRYVLGARHEDFPRELTVETSLDGVSWAPARQGDVIAEFIEGSLAYPRAPVVILPFAPRQGRYVRLRQMGKDTDASWAIGELEIWSGAGAETSKSY